MIVNEHSETNKSTVYLRCSVRHLFCVIGECIITGSFPDANYILQAVECKCWASHGGNRLKVQSSRVVINDMLLQELISKHCMQFNTRVETAARSHAKFAQSWCRSVGCRRSLAGPGWFMFNDLVGGIFRHRILDTGAIKIDRNSGWRRYHQRPGASNLMAREHYRMGSQLITECPDERRHHPNRMTIMQWFQAKRLSPSLYWWA